MRERTGISVVSLKRDNSEQREGDPYIIPMRILHIFIYEGIDLQTFYFSVIYRTKQKKNTNNTNNTKTPAMVINYVHM